MALTPDKRKIGGTTSDVPFRDGFSDSFATCGLLRRLFLMLLLDFLGIAVKENIDHDVPVIRRARDRATQTEHLARKQPPDEVDCVTHLAVCWDSQADILEGRVCVGEGNDRDVDIGRLADRLVIDARVGHDYLTRLLEGAGDVVRELICETSRDRLRIGGILEHCAMAVRSCRDHRDVVRVLDSGNNSNRKNELLPCLSHVEDVDTCARYRHQINRA